MTFEQLIKETLALRDDFNKKSTSYDKRDRTLDLVEEVGELANAVLLVEKRKKVTPAHKQRSVTDIADALSDMLFNMVVLAEDYNIDLIKDYERMLVELKKRIKKGEFS
jgi:NTP pyrophosphatase (non-canonical NTP hydrolase)